MSLARNIYDYYLELFWEKVRADGQEANVNFFLGAKEPMAFDAFMESYIEELGQKNEAITKKIVERDVNLARGRKAGVKKRKETAKEKKVRMEKAINDLFTRPDSPGWVWTNEQMTKWLFDKCNPKLGYAYSSILQAVKTIAAAKNKERKAELASKFPVR